MPGAQGSFVGSLPQGQCSWKPPGSRPGKGGGREGRDAQERLGQRGLHLTPHVLLAAGDTQCPQSFTFLGCFSASKVAMISGQVPSPVSSLGLEIPLLGSTFQHVQHENSSRQEGLHQPWSFKPSITPAPGEGKRPQQQTGLGVSCGAPATSEGSLGRPCSLLHLPAVSWDELLGALVALARTDR